ATDSATAERTGPPQAATAPAPAKAPRRQQPSGPTRREFLRKSWLIAWLGTLGGFAGASLAFLWPSLKGGFGAKIDVDTEEAILQYIEQNREPYAYPAGRMYLVAYDPGLDPEAQYAEVTQNGQSKVMALYQRCVHLGCRVPWCASSQWFECPCHGSKYNRWGEYRHGPAPRGLDRFPLTVENGRVIVDTAQIITGPSRQTAMLDQPPEGPHCN
ncbi:MAG: Rieske 2Fe-2S domain-containing protein, partial [Actinomycetota bacterium]|nr:Rieske 2Fe-2S domain-containing protein [Actinomycetota bacterium]